MILFMCVRKTNEHILRGGRERERGENAHMHVDGCRGQKRGLDALGLEL